GGSNTVLATFSMSVSTADFWKLLVESHLASAEQAQERQAKNAKSKVATAGGSEEGATTIEQGMGAHGLLSKFQPTVVLSGRGGPFVFGDYLMHDRFGEGRFKGTFRGVHLPTRSRVLLSFHTGAAVQNPKHWERLVKYTTQTIKAVNPHVSRIYQ